MKRKLSNLQNYLMSENLSGTAGCYDLDNFKAAATLGLDKIIERFFVSADSGHHKRDELSVKHRSVLRQAKNVVSTHTDLSQ